MPRKLKVFRTPIGFHDAYVAAPSRKAALEAWGASADLFARGIAEEVDDPRLTAQPLKRPGEVIRVSRGDLKAQLKALGPRKSTKRETTAETQASVKPARQKQPPRRDKVDRAEAALAKARHEQALEVAVIEKKRAMIDRELTALKSRHAKAVARLEEKLEQAQADYGAALKKWSS